MTRITTKSIMQGYNRGLTNALNRWNAAQNKVLTQKNFSEIWEDPAGANRSFQLRRQFRNNANSLELTSQTQSLMDQVTSATMQITDILTKDVNHDILGAINGTSSSADRATYAQTLRGMQQSIILAANSNVGGRFIFSGASTQEVPFVLSEDGKTLTYRGIDVSSTDPADQAKLSSLAKETLYVDLGFGMKETTDGNGTLTSITNTADGTDLIGTVKLNGQSITSITDINFTSMKDGDTLEINGTTFTFKTGADGTNNEFGNMDSLITAAKGSGISIAGYKTVSTSAFNTSTPGINLLGYGVDGDGDPKNVVALLGKMADELEKEPFDETTFNRLFGKFENCLNTATDYEASLGTKSKFLETTETRLKAYNDTLNARIAEVENVDMPEAISTYLWQGYAYNAALKVGTNIISNSLIDFMK